MRGVGGEGAEAERRGRVVRKGEAVRERRGMLVRVTMEREAERARACGG